MAGQARSFKVDPAIITYLRDPQDNSDLVNKYNVTLHGTGDNQGKKEYYSVGIFIQLSRLIFASFQRSNEFYDGLDNFICFFNNPSIANNVVDVSLKYASAEHIPASLVGTYTGVTKARVDEEVVDHPCYLDVSSTGEFKLTGPAVANELKIITSTGKLLGRPFDQVSREPNYSISAFVEGTNPELAFREFVVVHLDDFLRPTSASGTLQAEANECKFPYDAPPPLTIDYERQLGQPEACEGDFCNVATGNKFQSEPDYVSANSGGLIFTRSYNSANGLWRHTYERTITAPSGSAQNGQGQVTVTREDGKIIRFLGEGSDTYAAPPGINMILTIRRGTHGAQTGWKIVTESDSTEQYDLAGRLESVTSRSGLKHTLTYQTVGSKTVLGSVKDAFARTLTFKHDANGRLTSLTDPAGYLYTYGYDSLGRLATVTYPDQMTRSYIYNEPEMTGGTDMPLALTGVVDEKGVRYATWKYDATGRVVLSEHAGGVDRVSLNYIIDNDGKRYTEVTDSNGYVRTYQLASVGGVIKVIGMNSICDTCQDDAISREYDESGNLIERVDRAGNRTSRTFDGQLNLELTRNESNIRFTQTEWHEKFRLPTRVTTDNRETSYEYDPLYGTLLKTTVTDRDDQTSRSWIYTYFTGTRLLKTINGPRTDLKDETSFTYDIAGNLSTVTNALGHITHISLYDKNGRAGSVTDPNGLVTLFTYDSRGKIKALKVGEELTTYAYNAIGLPETITFPSGEVVTYSYDDAHRLIGIRNSAGERIHYTLDGFGNTLKEEIFDAGGTMTSLHRQEFDQYNRLRKVIQSGDSTTFFDTDEKGNIIGMIDSLGRQTFYKFDEIDRIREVTRADNAVEKIDFSAYDQLTRVVNAKDVPVTYTVNALGDVKAIDTPDPDAHARANTFDSAGNVKTKRDARGVLTTYTYDALNRVKTISAPGVTSISFEYDAGTNGKGRLTSIVDESGTTTRTYNGQGQLATSTRVFAGLTMSTRYTYDTAGRLKELTYPSGRVVSYRYEKNQIVGVDVGPNVLLSEVKYQPFGAAKSWRWGNGTVYTRTFDLDSNLMKFPIGESVRTLTRDGAGNITKMEDNLDSTKNQKFGYDELGRITDYLTGPAYTLQEHFDYDLAGNRTDVTTGGHTFTYSYLDGTDFLAAVSGPVAKQWIPNATGSLLGDGTRTFKIDSLRRIIGVTNDGVTTDYIRNGLQQRVTKRSSDGAATHFIYDEEGQLIAEIDRFGNTVLEHVWLGDQPIGAVRDGNLYYVFADQLNTPRLITDVSNLKRWSWHSNPFGSAAPNENPSGAGDFVYNLRFPGQFYDAESELHYNYFRDYDPQTGRYVQSDPIGLAGGINTYGYVSGNPLRFTDPTGEVALVDDAVIGIGVAAIILMSPPGQKALKDFAKSVVDVCKTDPCEQLIKEANDIAGKLKTKLAAQYKDRWDLYNLAYRTKAGGYLGKKGTWLGHEGPINGLKVGLQRKISELMRHGCPVPPDLIKLLSIPTPTKPGPMP